MRAAVFRQAGSTLEIAELALEDPRAGEVRIDVAASGICRSDLSVTTGTLRSPLPVVLGHEAAGKVTQLGEGVDDLQLGDHVVVSLTPACGDCLFCKEGAPNRCLGMVPGMIGSTMRDGTGRSFGTIRDFSKLASHKVRSFRPGQDFMTYLEGEVLLSVGDPKDAKAAPWPPDNLIFINSPDIVNDIGNEEGNSESLSSISMPSGGSLSNISM